MAKIAGTESTAKIRSTNSTITKARNRGVAHTTGLPVCGWGRVTRNLLPTTSGVMRILRRKNFSTGLFAMSGIWSAMIHILMPVNTKNTPNTYKIQLNSDTSAAPRLIMMARSTITPKMPQNSTRYWYWRGIAK